MVLQIPWKSTGLHQSLKFADESTSHSSLPFSLGFLPDYGPKLESELVARQAAVTVEPANITKAPGTLVDDSAAPHDWLRVRAMCHAVANFILNEGTSPPVAIAFQGPWGKGKSTVMNLVENSLRILPLLWEPGKVPGRSESQVLGAKLTLKSVRRKLIEENSDELKNLDELDLLLNTSDLRKSSLVGRVLSAWQQAGQRTGKKGANYSRGEALAAHKGGLTGDVTTDGEKEMFELGREGERSRLLEEEREPENLRVAHKTTQLRQLQLKALEKAASKVVLSVRFNAWLYRDIKEVWAGMAVTIGKAMEERLGWRRRWRVYVAYGLQKRRREFVTSVLVPLVLAVSLTLILALSAPSIVRAFRTPIAAPPAPAGAKVSTPVAPAYKATDTLTLILGGLGGAATILLAVWRTNAFLKPISQRIADYVSSPTTTHEANIGYQHSVISDLEFLGERLPGLRLVVFIDDLDRCQDKAVVSVLEAVNLVLGGCSAKRLRIFTVLGLDMEMTVTAIHNFYNSQATSESLERERVTREDSRRFLQKIIQVSIDVPATTKASRETFIRRLFGETREELQSSLEILTDLEEPIMAQTADNISGTSTVANPTGIEEAESSPIALAESDGRAALVDAPNSEIRELPQVLDQDVTQIEPVVPEALILDLRKFSIRLNGNHNDDRGKRLMALFSDVLPDNPRDIKRMVNNYRLAANVLEWSGNLDYLSDVTRDRLVVWVVLVVTFPSLASDIAWLCRQPETEGEKRDGLEQLRDRLDRNIRGKKKDLLRLVRLIGSFPSGAKATELLALEKAALALRQTLEQKIKELAHFEKFWRKTVTLKGRFRTVKDFLPFRQFGAGLYLHSEREEWGQSDLQDLAAEIAATKDSVKQGKYPLPFEQQFSGCFD